MAEEAHTQPLSRKRTVVKIVAIISVLIVAAALGGLLRWAMMRHNPAPARKLTPGSLLPAVVDDVQNERFAGNDAEAQKKIDTALKDSKTTKEERYMLYIQQGNIAADKKDHAAAIDAYVKAEQVSSTYEVSHLLGEEYEAAGNKAKAIEYYQKAIDKLPEKDPLRDEEAASYQQKIKDLGGQ